MTDAEFVREIAQPLASEARDYNALLQLIDDARFVLIGEASHGTHEFYFERAAITKRLIAEKDFSILAIEADWPDSARVHRYVRGVTSDANPDQALSGFRRFPTWMWRNKVVLEFVEWLRGFNEKLDPNERRSDSTGWIFTACMPQSKRCLGISTKSIPRLRGVRGCATPVSIISAMTRRSTPMPPLSAQSNHVRMQ